MKKYIVSGIVILSFVGYSFYQRVYGQEAVIAIPEQKMTSLPVTPTTTDQPTPTNLPTPTTSIVKKAIPTNAPLPTNTPAPTQKPKGIYSDGSYTGDPADAFYGIIQVQITIIGGKLTNVVFLQYPNTHGRSVQINQIADPILAQEAIAAQSAQVDIVSGATASSQAFIESMQSALIKAKS